MAWQVLAVTALVPPSTSSFRLQQYQPSCPATRALPFIMAEGGSGDDGDGRGGAGNRGRGGGGDGDGDDDKDEQPSFDVAKALSEAGLESEFPADVLEAFKAGRIGAAELANWKSVVGNPLLRLLAMSGYVRARLLASSTLSTILGIEIAVGCLSTLAAEKAARGTRFGNELDFVMANQALIVVTNIALVLVLAPVAAVAPPPAAGTFAALAAKWPSFVLQKGKFSVLQRLACVATKSVQFAFIGSMTSLVGQAGTLGVLNLRSRLESGTGPGVVLPPVVPTASAYAVFMGLSSCSRYQLVNSLEAALLPRLPGGMAAQTLSSCVLRTYNSFLGSANWNWWARYRGL